MNREPTACSGGPPWPARTALGKWFDSPRGIEPPDSRHDQARGSGAGAGIVPALQCVLELQPQLRGEILEIDAGGADELAIGDEAVGVGSAMSLPPVVMASAEDLRRIRDPEAAKRQPALCRRGVARSQVGRVPGSARTRSAGSGPTSPRPRSSNAATSASTSRWTAVASWSATRCRSASRSRPSSRSDPTRTGCRTPAAKSPAVSSDNHPNVHIDPRRSHMSTAQATSNKATFSLFQDAMNTGDAECSSRRPAGRWPGSAGLRCEQGAPGCRAG